MASATREAIPESERIGRAEFNPRYAKKYRNKTGGLPPRQFKLRDIDNGELSFDRLDCEPLEVVAEVVGEMRGQAVLGWLSLKVGEALRIAGVESALIDEKVDNRFHAVLCCSAPEEDDRLELANRLGSIASWVEAPESARSL